MLNENAKKWVAALRSGEFKQGRQSLRSAKDEFCCLGVACELATREGVIASPHLDEHGIEYRYAGSVAILPPDVQNWLGISKKLGQYTDANGDSSSLASQNDGGSTFAQIADLIESEPQGLFV